MDGNKTKMTHNIKASIDRWLIDHTAINYTSIDYINELDVYKIANITFVSYTKLFNVDCKGTVTIHN